MWRKSSGLEQRNLIRHNPHPSPSMFLLSINVYGVPLTPPLFALCPIVVCVRVCVDVVMVGVIDLHKRQMVGKLLWSWMTWGPTGGGVTCAIMAFVSFIISSYNNSNERLCRINEVHVSGTSKGKSLLPKWHVDTSIIVDHLDDPRVPAKVHWQVWLRTSGYVLPCLT